jgi:dTDP-4-dehydrorhamnose reductase
MRCLLIGASGQLGRALHAVFSSGHEVIATAHRHVGPGYLRLDLGDVQGTRRLLREINPDLVLIAGAMCAVDRCESERDLCRRVNVDGPRAVAEYGHERGARVVYFSTDHVFDGTREAYGETDAIRPLSFYAASKAEGEGALRQLLSDRHLVIRTSWLYGPDARRMNFALRCVDSIRAGRSVPVPEDQWGSPTYTEDLAQATRFLVEHGYIGTFHATGPEFVDRASLTLRICAHFGLDQGCIVAKPTSELAQAAPRPLRVRLDCAKLREAGVSPFRGIDRGLEALAAFEALVSKR